MASDAIKLERERRKSAREERMGQLLADPLVLSLAGGLAGVYLAERIRWSGDEGRDQRLRAAVLAMILYASLSRVGAKGWPVAAASIGGGIAAGASGGGTAFSPLQAGEAALVGAGVGSIVPGVGTLVGGGIGLGVDAIYQWVS